MDFGMPFLLECPSIESACALCAKLGLQFVELNLSFPLCNLDALTAQRLNSLCAQYGLYFTFHLDEELAPCAFDSRVRAAYVDCALRAITLARETGTPTVNLHWPRGVYVTLPDRVTYLFENYREDYLQNARQFRDVCTQASEGHVNICVENTNGFLPFQQEAVDMLLESPAFGLTLDIGHDYTAPTLLTRPIMPAMRTNCATCTPTMRRAATVTCLSAAIWIGPRSFAGHSRREPAQ